MGSARANANQALYLAKIVLAAWRDARDAGDIPPATLASAFRPPVRGHLLEAYGWFLLEIMGEELPPDGTVPAGVADLPERPAGKAESGELREFRQMEAEGWLHGLLAPPGAAVQHRGGRDSLAVEVPAQADLADAADWAERLEALFGRMRDSLDEY